MKTENEIQKELFEICDKHEKVAWIDRANSGHVKYKGGHLQLHKKGTADLIGMTVEGYFIGIEVKTVSAYHSKDMSMNEDQIAFADMINSTPSGVCGTACDSDTLYNNILNKL
jgi:hypothetical protein